MPEALKHRLGPAAVRRIAAGLRQAWPAFPADAFEARCLDGGDDRELSARAVHIADTMRAMLPPDYREAVRVVIAALGPPVDPEAPNPDATWRWLHDWAGHDDVHLRRLASECTRARLPWARQVAALRHEPQRTLALLERLRDDPARYVQRSVANNLNDLSRDHPDRVLATCTRWWADGGDNRRWIVRHALRTLLKRGDPQALALLGAGAAPRLDLRQVSWQPQRPQVGGTLRLRWQLASTHDAPQALRVDLRLQPPDGVATRPRVFRVRTVTPLPPGGTLDQGLTLSFEPMTTRRHHPGVHRVWLQINGHDLPLGTFELAAAG